MAEVGTIDWVIEDGPTDCVGKDGPTDCVGEDGVTPKNDTSGLNVWVRKLTVCSWWGVESDGVGTNINVVWADEMGVVVWAVEMGVVVWAIDIGGGSVGR